MTTIAIAIVTALAGLIGAPVSSGGTSGQTADLYVNATYDDGSSDGPADSNIWYWCP